MKGFALIGLGLLIGAIVLAARLAKPTPLRKKGSFSIFSGSAELEGPFIAWLKERGFAAVEGGFRGPSGTKAPMTVQLEKKDGRVVVSTLWTFDGFEGEDSDDEEKAFAFNKTLSDWFETRKTP